MPTGRFPVTGVILAGGRGRRMGGSDKGLVEVEGWPLIDRVIAALAPQVQQLLINANRNIQEYESYGYPVVPDELPGYQGPLAGMLTGLHNASNTHVVFVPCDALSLPPDLVARLRESLIGNDAEACIAHDGTRLHPVFALLDRRLAGSLEQYLVSGGHTVEAWVLQQKHAVVDFSDCPQGFVNLNTPADLEGVSQV